MSASLPATGSLTVGVVDAGSGPRAGVGALSIVVAIPRRNICGAKARRRGASLRAIVLML